MTHLRDNPGIRPELERGLLPRWVERRQLGHQQTAALAQAVEDTGQPRPTADRQLWDMSRDPSHALRGIPCIAKGVSGTQPGTQPLLAIVNRA